jgi:hypothetical protein
VATRKFFPADQLARWTGSIVAFMGLRKEIKCQVNSEDKLSEVTKVPRNDMKPYLLESILNNSMTNTHIMAIGTEFSKRFIINE